MKIGVIGVGRLGICFALLLDRGGYDVMASDIRTNYVAALQRRQIRTNEPGVAEMLALSKIDFTTDTREVIRNSEVIYVMVATPSLAEGSYDISAVQRIVDDIRECDFDLTGKILVIGCTTNPGDCQRIQDQVRDLGLHVLYNPEFIAQGTILQDLAGADMVLIGGERADVMLRYQEVYQAIQPAQAANIHTMSLTSAELVKIAVNCFLTTKISFANMVGEVLIESGQQQDVAKALAAIGSDSRIGSKYLKYGFGYGGPCLPRDNRAFASYAQKLDIEFDLGSVVDRFNKKHTEFLFHQLTKRNPSGRAFYISSVSYKPGTDIYDESQPLALVERLLATGHRVIVEPSTTMPPDLQQALLDKYQGLLSFLPRSQAGDVLEIES